ncbi:unnamed protein product [Arabidopsis arenosa]|uniref:EGF-like calcium-binding domain-containing protein n=1 Tax=Arabidopsis arenosa TaxID=38785 RepID=A0A8S1ZTD1_ARAAE|nr:unnamed protein product [Arabidopsis arenosa]
MSSNNTCSLLIFLFSLLLLLILNSAALTSLDTCRNYCGKLDIPYPFGIGKGCYLDKGYEIECKTVSGKDVPFLSVSSKEVVDISLPRQNHDRSMSHASLHIKSPLNSSNKQGFGSFLNSTGQRNSQWLHAKQYATLELEWSLRTTNPSLITSLGCQNKLEYTGLSHKISCTCQNKTDISGIIYASCGCTEGYRGNPYLLGGCIDINECKVYDEEENPKYCGEYPCVNFQGGYRCNYNPYYGLTSLTLRSRVPPYCCRRVDVTWMKENRVVDIIDARIRDDCKLEQVMAVAQVARRCLNLKRIKRPSMRQVSMELEMIRSSPEDMQPLVYVSENEEEAMELNIRVESRNDVVVTAPASQYNVAASSSSCFGVYGIRYLYKGRQVSSDDSRFVARSCPRTCGGIDIPYPFGIGMGCYLEKWYEIVCVNNSVPYLSIINKEVVSISFSDTYSRFFDVGYGSIRIKNPITSKGCSSGGQELGSLLNLTGYPFYLGDNNMLIAVGCNNTASLTNVEPSIVGCESTCSRKQQMPINDYLGVVYCNTKSRGSEFCSKISTMNDTSCNGTGCCKAGMPDRYQQIIDVEIDDNNTQSRGCKVAFLTDEEYFLSNGSDPERLHAKGYVTVELRWFIHTANHSFIGSLGCKSIEEFTVLRRDNAKVDGVGCLCDYNSSSYATCSCSSGYEGNPYLPGECKDINECVRGIGGEQIVCPRGKCVNLQGDYRCEYTNHRPLVIAQSPSSSSTSCNRICGGIEIPFPFGIGRRDCYLNDWYEVVCNTTISGPFLSKINRELVSITLRNSIDSSYGVVQIKSPVTSSGCSKRPEKPLPLNLTGKGSPFFITDSNRLVSVGCNTRALITDIESQITGCESSCDGDKTRLDKICGGYRCCQAKIPADRPQIIGVTLESSGGNATQGSDCKVAFLTNETYSPANVTEPEQFYTNGFTVIELGWYFDTSDSRLTNPVGCVNLTETGIYTSAPSCVCEYGYFSGFGYSNCYCNQIGYRGNPYLPGGCIDIDECEEGKGRNSCGEQTCVNVPGSWRCEPKEAQKIKPVFQGLVLGLALLFLVLGIWGLIKFVKKRKKIIRKRMFFKRKKRPYMREVSIELERIRSSPEDLEVHIEEEDEEETAMEINMDDSWSVDMTAPASLFDLSPKLDVEPLVPQRTW